MLALSSYGQIADGILGGRYSLTADAWHVHSVHLREQPMISGLAHKCYYTWYSAIYAAIGSTHMIVHTSVHCTKCGLQCAVAAVHQC